MTTNRLYARLLCSAATLLVSAYAQAASAQTQVAENSSGAGSTVETVVVTASRVSELARMQQKNALNVINVQSAEDIAKYPDYNAGEALGRVPGISLSSDTGEGRYVTIRGIDGNLDGATYGGVVLLNTNPALTYFTGAGRAVEFDTIPMGAIDGIVLTKTGMPDQEAEGLGGSIELTPRSAATIDKDFFVEATLGGGYENLRPNWSPRRGEVTIGGRFDLTNGLSKDGPFSFVLTASEFDDSRAIDDVEEGYADSAGIPDKVFSALELRRYNYHRRRFGLGGDFEYQPDDNDRYYIRASMAGYIESVNRQRLVYDNLSDVFAIDPSNSNGFLSNNTQMTASLRDEEEQHRNTVIAAGGENRFGEVVLDYEASYSRATFTKNKDINPTFDGPAGISVAYDNVTNPNFPTIKNLSGVNLRDPSLYTLSKIQNSTEDDADQERALKADFTMPLHLLGDADEFKIGAKARIRDKTYQPLNFGYMLPGTTPTLADLLGSGPFTNFYDNNYNIGSRADFEKVRSYIVSAGLVAVPNLARNAAAFVHAKEDIFAGFAQYDATFGPLTALAGVRVEHTQARYDGIATTTDALGNVTFTPNTHGNNYTNAFPTVQLRYQFMPDLVARLTYSTGIGRPGFLLASSSTQIDFSAAHPGIVAVVTSGNPNLKPTTGNNFDFSLEYYLPEGGIVSFGAFDKEFTDFIFARTQKNVLFPGVGTVDLQSFSNLPSTWARGFEASYSQKFTFLPAPFDGFGASANGTLVNSNAEIYPGFHAAMPGTSHMTANAAIFYENFGFKGQLALEYVGKTQFGITGSPATDNFEDHRTTLDFTSSYDIADYLTVYFNAKNLTNSPLRFYERAENRPIQREFYSYTLESGLKLSL